MKITNATDLRRAFLATQADIQVVAAYLESALQQIDQGMPGFPSGLDGGGANDGLTQVERLATTPDKAREYERRMFAFGGAIYDQMRDWAKLTAEIGRTPAPPPVVKGDIPDGWCEQHYNILHSYEQTRRLGGTYCRFCEDFKRNNKGVLPSRALLELHARKAGRLSEADITRTMRGKVA